MNYILIFTLISCFIYACSMLFYLGSLLGYRFEKYKWASNLLTGTVFTVYAYISRGYLWFPVIYILAFIFTILLCHLLLKGSWLQHMFASGNFLFHILIGRGMILVSISLAYRRNIYWVVNHHNLNELVVCLSFIAGFFYLLIFAYRLYPLKDILSVANRTEYLIILTASQGALNILLLLGDTVYFVWQTPVWSSLYHLIAYILIFITFYILFNFCVKSSALLKYKSAYLFYKQQLRKQVDAYTLKSEHTQNLREFFHDWNHIKGALHLLNETGSKEDVLRFLDEIDVTIHNLSGSFKEYSGNPLIQAILLHTCILSQKQNIDFDASAALPGSSSGENSSILPLSDLDLCRIFTNITNNALEANEHLDGSGKFIRIATSVSDNWYTITCVNSYNGIVKRVNGELQTLKKDTLSHGFGIKNIEEISNACGGFMNIDADAESGIFRIHIHIPLLPNTAAD